MLEVRAGNRAAQIIKEQGLHAEQFRAILGASGGPKWFVLFGLDKYLFGEFFKDKKTDIATLGTSAGAWRLSCFAQNDPVAAITRLAEGYSTTVYGSNAGRKEITEKSQQLISHMLAGDAIAEIVNNPNVKSNIIVNRCKGLTAYEPVLVQMLGLLPAAAANRCSRSLLRFFFERVVMTTGEQSQPQFDFQDAFGGKQVALNEQNYRDSLMASGSIPLILEGVKNIQGAPKGMYRDGGIIDYHFDLDFTQDPAYMQQEASNSLVLYPHFYADCKPGWFDKSIASRQASRSHFDNVVMLVPNPEFVKGLPYSKIPDRNDFKQLDAQQRIRYWQTVLSESDCLAEQLDNWVENGISENDIKPLFQ